MAAAGGSGLGVMAGLGAGICGVMGGLESEQVEWVWWLVWERGLVWGEGRVEFGRRGAQG